MTATSQSPHLRPPETPGRPPARPLRRSVGHGRREPRPRRAFLELGLDSLFLTQAALLLRKTFGVKVSFRELLEELSTIDALAAHLDRHPSRRRRAGPSPAAAPASTPSAPQPAAAARAPPRPPERWSG